MLLTFFPFTSLCTINLNFASLLPETASPRVTNDLLWWVPSGYSQSILLNFCAALVSLISYFQRTLSSDVIPKNTSFWFSSFLSRLLSQLYFLSHPLYTDIFRFFFFLRHCSIYFLCAVVLNFFRMPSLHFANFSYYDSSSHGGNLKFYFVSLPHYYSKTCDLGSAHQIHSQDTTYGNSVNIKKQVSGELTSQ